MIETPTYTIYRVDAPLTIDGVLDEPAWQTAPTIALREALHGGEPRQQTVSRLLWDDVYLYASWVCEDRDIWGSMTQRGDYIYNEEVVELFTATASAMSRSKSRRATRCWISLC